MMWGYNPYAVVQFIAGGISLAVAVFAWQRRAAAGAKGMALLMLALTEWAWAYGMELISVEPAAKLFWSAAHYPGIAGAAIAWPVFVLEYTGRDNWLSRRNLVVLCIMPLTSLVLAATNEWHGLLWTNWSVEETTPYRNLVVHYAPWFWVHTVYVYGAFLISTGMLLVYVLQSTHLYVYQTGLVVLAVLAPFVGNVLFLSRLSPGHLDLTPSMFLISGTLLTLGLLRFGFLDLTPIARDQIVEQMADGVLVLDAQGRIADLNPAARRIVGGTASRLVGRPAHEVFAGYGDFVEAVGGVSEAHSEIVIADSTGVPHPYEMRISSLERAAGKPGGRVVALRDISERVRAERALRESEEQFRQLAEHIHDVFWVCNRPLTEVLYLSPAFEMHTGLARDRILANPAAILDAIHPEDREAFSAALQRIARGHVDEAEYRLIRPDGSVRWTWGRGFPILDERGLVVRMVGIWRDITERKRIEQEKATLLEVARDVAGTLDTAQILERVQSRIAALLPCDAVVTFYWDTARQVHRMVSQHNVAARFLSLLQALEFDADHPMARRLLEGAVVIDDVAAQELLPANMLQEFGLSAMVGTPLIVRGGELIGCCFAYQSRTGHGQRFEPDQVRLFEGITQFVALALESAYRYREQQEDAQVEAALARVSREVIAAADTPVLLDRLCELTAQSLSADVCYTWLWDDDEGVYQPASHYGDRPADWEVLRMYHYPRHLMSQLEERLASEKMVEVSLDGPVVPLPYPVVAQLRAVNVKRTVYVALERGGQMFAVLQALYREQAEPLTAQQLRIAEGIAQIAPLALETARLFEELGKANRVREHFVAMLSHELRNPITAIGGYHSLLLEEAVGALNEQQREFLEHAAKCTAELGGLITATLDLSRFEADRVKVDLGEVRLPDLLAELSEEIFLPPDRPELSVDWHADDGVGVLRTDSLKLKMVLRNLVTNAIKFTERGHVTVEARALGDGVELRVADTGMGIPAEALPKLFEPFQQAHGAESRRRGGAGLGLYLVRRLTEILGGRVDVASEVGRGSTFRVWLPKTLDLGASPSHRVGSDAVGTDAQSSPVV